MKTSTYEVYNSQLIRSAKRSSHATTFNARSKTENTWYTFPTGSPTGLLKLYFQHYELLLKIKVGLSKQRANDHKLIQSHIPP